MSWRNIGGSKKYPQAELYDPSDAKYLGITVGHDWDDIVAQENEAKSAE